MPFGRRILVTGGCGFIGHHLVHRLLACGHEVSVLDDLSGANPTRFTERTHLVVHHGSVLHAPDVARAAKGCAAVFHLAGVVGTRSAFGDPQRAFTVAVEGTHNVLQNTRPVPVVMFSSSTVYGLAGAEPLNECPSLDEPASRTYDGGVAGYATGKFRMEAAAACAARDGRPVLIVRPFNVVGPGQSEQSGMVVPSFVANALAGRPLVIYGDGRQTRTFSHVRTFTACLLKVVRMRAVWHGQGTPINIGARVSTSIDQLARLVLDMTASRSQLRQVPYAEVFPGHTDVRTRTPDTRRLEGLIGCVSWPSIREIVRDVVHDRTAHTTDRRDDALGTAGAGLT